MLIHHIILFVHLCRYKLMLLIFLKIKNWLLLLLDRYFIFGLEMDILDIVKIWIYSFNWTISVNSSILY